MLAKEHGPLMMQWVEYMMESAWDIDVSGTTDTIRFETSYSNCVLKWDLRFHEEEKRIFMSTQYEKISNNKYYKNVVRVVNDLNGRCTMGRFAFDPEKGIVSYGYGINLNNVTVTQEFIEEVIRAIADSAHAFHPHVAKVMDGMSVACAL